MATIVRGPISARIRFAEGIYADIVIDMDTLANFIPVSDEPYASDIKCADASETPQTIGIFTFYPFELAEYDDEGA